MNICRLCAMEHNSGVEIFSGCEFESSSLDWDKLVISILGYLGQEYVNAGVLPNWLCACCQLEARETDNFLLLVQEGQNKLQHLAIKQAEDVQEIVATEEQELPETTAVSKSQHAMEAVLKRHTTNKNIKKVHHNSLLKSVKFIENTLETTVDGIQRPKRQRRIPHRFRDETENREPSSQEISQCETVDIESGVPIIKQSIAKMSFFSDQQAIAEIIEVTPTPSNSSSMRLLCEYCKQLFPTEKQFLKHMETHTNHLFKCTVCEQKFCSEVALENHKTKEHDETKAIDNLANLFKAANPAINIVVGTNGQITSIDSTLSALDTYNTVSTAITLPDNDMSNITPSIKSMHNQMAPSKLHKIKCNKITTYACLKCEKTFDSNYAVRRHHKQVHIAERAYKCSQCPARFKNKSNYDYHLANHAGQRPFRCEVCEKSFILKHELTIHMRVHTSEKPYSCDQCQKSFAYRTSLVVHQRIHKGLKPYKCSMCESTFNSSSHLKVHTKVHLKKEAQRLQAQTDADSEPCAEFLDAETKSILVENSNSLLKRSLLKSTITSEKKSVKAVEKSSNNATKHTTDQQQNGYKFQCSDCYKYFRLKSTLTKHMRTHTGAKPYKCPLCPKSFADPSNFKKHKNLHKNATVELKNVSAKLSTATLKQQIRDMQRDEKLSLTTTTATSDLLITIDDLESNKLQDVEHLNEGKDEQQALLPVSSNDIKMLASNQLVCISYQDPTNPVDNKTTTFYVVN